MNDFDNKMHKKIVITSLGAVVGKDPDNRLYQRLQEAAVKSARLARPVAGGTSLDWGCCRCGQWPGDETKAVAGRGGDNDNRLGFFF